MGGSSKGGGQTIGYWYDMDVLATLCHGKVDENTDFEMVEIRFGDRTAWTGTVTGSETISIYQKELFGGEKREGGVYGQVDVMAGTLNQPVNEFLGTSMRLSGITGGVPAYRGEFSLFFRGVSGVNPEFAPSGVFVQVRTAPPVSIHEQAFGKPPTPHRAFRWSAMNPYFKAFKVRMRRFWKGWYASKSRIGNYANPAHIVYECLTNAEWGMGYPQADMDDARFRAAADKLFDEGFGIGLVWRQQTSIQEFVGLVTQHINAVVNQDRNTGKLFLRLIRQDYDVATLLELNPSNSILENYSRPGFGETVNEITLKYVTSEGQDDAVTVQDLANITGQGQIISQVVEMPGIHDSGLAARVAQRELESRSRPICKLTIVTNRIAFNLYEGEVFKFSWPEHGISQMVCRAVSVNLGSLQDNRITIEAVEDVFGLPLTSFVNPQPGGWVDPSNLPAASPYRYITETPYHELVRSLSASDLAQITNTETFIDVFATSPSRDALDYNLWTASSGGSLTLRGSGTHAPVAVLTTALVREEFSTLFVNSISDIIGQLTSEKVYLVVNGEYMKLTDYDIALNTLTVARGILDTVPIPHDVGSVVMLGDVYVGRDGVEYVTGEVVNVRVQTKTSRGVLNIDSTPQNDYTCVGRQSRPYPPGQLRINGSVYPAKINGPLSLTWAHRDRLLQSDQMIDQSVGNIGPEANTIYQLTVLNETNGTLYTQSSNSTSAFISEPVSAGPFDYATDRDMRIAGIGLATGAVATAVNNNSILTPSAGVIQLRNLVPVTGGYLSNDGVFIDGTTGSVTTRTPNPVAPTQLTAKTGVYLSVYTVNSSGAILSYDPYIGWAVVARKTFGGSDPTPIPPGALLPSFNGYFDDTGTIRDRRVNTNVVVSLVTTSQGVEYYASDFLNRRAIYKEITRISVLRKSRVQSNTAPTTDVVVHTWYRADPAQFNSATGQYISSYSPASESGRRIIQHVNSAFSVIFGNLLYVPHTAATATASTSGKSLDVTNVFESHIDYATQLGDRTAIYSIDVDGNLTFIATRTGLVLADQVSATLGVEITNGSVRTVNITTGALGSVIATLPSGAKATRVAGDTSSETFYVMTDDYKIHRYNLSGTLLTTVSIPASGSLAWADLYGLSSMAISSGYLWVHGVRLNVAAWGGGYAAGDPLIAMYQYTKDLTSYKTLFVKDIIGWNHFTQWPTTVYDKPVSTTLVLGKQIDETGTSTNVAPVASPRFNSQLTIELKSNRGGIDSYQKHSIVQQRTGWGLRWGETWGG